VKEQGVGNREEGIGRIKQGGREEKRKKRNTMQ
jgi:hypothetical protein